MSWVPTPTGPLSSVPSSSQRVEPGSHPSLLSLSALFRGRNDGAEPPFLTPVLGGALSLRMEAS